MRFIDGQAAGGSLCVSLGLLLFLSILLCYKDLTSALYRIAPAPTRARLPNPSISESSGGVHEFAVGPQLRGPQPSGPRPRRFSERPWHRESTTRLRAAQPSDPAREQSLRAAASRTLAHRGRTRIDAVPPLRRCQAAW